MMWAFVRVLVLSALPALAVGQTINVGSKRFTESYILGEILSHKMREAGEAAVAHQRGLGNTAIVFAALRNGSIDLYPEYTGTIAFELLNRPEVTTVDELRRALAEHRLGVAIPLGFSNSYSVAMLEPRADSLGVKRISDLARRPELEVGVSQEFLNRRDGWPALKRAYALPQTPRGLDHGLAYEALAAGRVDVIDVYATDAKITRYSVRQLEDDRRFFPRYDAVVLYRLDLPQRFPRAWAALQSLENTIDARAMAHMNAEAELSGRAFDEVARAFLRPTAMSRAAEPHAPGGRTFLTALFAADLPRVTIEHLALVLASLVPAAALGIPLGTWAAYSPRSSRWIMAAVSLMQTVPALALLAFLITLMGTIGTAPAVVALFLYALLPIVRNTASGLADIPAPLREAAHALGLPTLARLRRVELPLASRSILAGVKTSAVIAVGTATIAAFIGAGGYGERIVAGLAVNDTALLLAGAVPAAALALFIQWLFDTLERFAVPAGLRSREDVTSGGP